MALNAAQEEDFRRFVEANWDGFVRSAYLMVGDHGTTCSSTAATPAKPIQATRS